MENSLNRVAAAAALSLMGLALAYESHAQSGAEFFNGKTINYIVATDPGGGYDTNGRLVSEFMQKHLPGSTFVVRNVPGAGHIIGVNALPQVVEWRAQHFGGFFQASIKFGPNRLISTN